jgi:hypothetical protein
VITAATCVVCNRPTPRRLCSTACQGEAAYERERNLRRLRMLRRAGSVTASQYLVQRNVELHTALLAGAFPDRGRARLVSEV